MSKGKMNISYTLDKECMNLALTLSNFEKVVNDEISLAPSGTNYFYYVLARCIFDHALYMLNATDSYSDEEYNDWFEREGNIFLIHIRDQQDTELRGLYDIMTTIINKKADDLMRQFIGYGFWFDHEYDIIHSEGVDFIMQLRY